MTTPSLLLRHLVAEDAPAIMALSAEPSTGHWLPSHVDATLEASSARITALCAAYETPGDPRKGPYVLAVEHRESAHLLGHVGFSPLEGEAEVSYAIAEAFRGRGYGVEALSAALAWIAATFAVTEVIAITASANVASHRLLERVAFTLESEGPMIFQGREEVVRRYRWRVPE